jgi:hypothetical protein
MAQQKVAYQNSEEVFNCISARYCPYNGSGIKNKWRVFDKIDISVYNTGCKRSAEGVVQDCNNPEQPTTDFQNLGAIVSDPSKGKLNVLPTILPSVLKATGPYWIMAFGCETKDDIEDGTAVECGPDSANDYTWGVVVGGSPCKEYDAVDGSTAVCSTQVSGYIGGLWVFNSQKLTNFATGSPFKNFIYDKIHALGVTTSQLINVNHVGCPDFNDPCPPAEANLLGLAWIISMRCFDIFYMFFSLKEPLRDLTRLFQSLNLRVLFIYSFRHSIHAQ